jgi:hypothetical protein
MFFFNIHVGLYQKDDTVYIKIVFPDSISRTYHTSHKSIETSGRKRKTRGAASRVRVSSRHAGQLATATIGAL